MKTKSEIPLPKTVHKGAVCEQYFRCGKSNCRCARGELHGPYFAYFARHKGRLVKRYVRLSEAAQIAAQCQAARQQRADTRRLTAQAQAVYVRIKCLLQSSQTNYKENYAGRN